MSEIIDFPETGFTDQYSLYMKRRPSVILAIEREVVDPILIRNSEQESAETQAINGTTRAQSNPEKFITKERLTGLDLLRRLDEDGDLIDDEYAYNEPPAIEKAINLDTLTYGMAGTGDQDYGMKSRLIAGYTYSTGEYDIMQGEMRNAAYESGSMTNEKGEHSRALFEQVRVQPGNSFMHFLTLEAGTPAMLTYVLHNVLNTAGYGARETRSGKTIQNHIRGLVTAEQPALLSVGEFLRQYDPEPGSVTEALGSYINDHEQSDWQVSLEGEFPEWFESLRDVAGRHRDDADDILRELFVEDTADAFESIPK